MRPDRLSASKSKDSVQKNLHRQAKAATSRLEKLTEVKRPVPKKALQFPKHELAPLHNPYPLRVEHLTVSFGPNKILDDLSFQMPLGKKIAIVGDNGAGKTTLFQAILAKQHGITLSSKVKLVTYQQFDYRLQSDRPLLDVLMAESDWSEAPVRALLDHLGFSQTMVNNALSSLSGGEATRVAIARLFTRPSNFLILDEPTNFIDLKTIQALEELLQHYAGCVLFTSHDREFIQAVADEIWHLKDGKLLN